MRLHDVPGVPESRLPTDLVLPDVDAPAPWSTRVRATLWFQRGRAPVAAPAWPLVVGALVTYLDTPVGPYREVFAGPVLRRLRPTVTIPFIAVDSPASVVGGRRNWQLPKALATFDGGTARGDGWQVDVSAVPRGPHLPLRGRFATDQGGGPATVRLRGTGRLSVVRVSASGPTIADWIATGAHLGLVAEGRMDIGPTRGRVGA